MKVRSSSSPRGTTDLDWDTIDRLVENNKDFGDFMQDVVEDIQVRKIRGAYDISMNDEKLNAFVKEKGVI